MLDSDSDSWPFATTLSDSDSVSTPLPSEICLVHGSSAIATFCNLMSYPIFEFAEDGQLVTIITTGDDDENWVLNLAGTWGGGDATPMSFL